MIKLIHTADVHLDSPLKTLALRDPELQEKVQCASRTAFTRIVDQALEHEVAAVLIAGDLFDGASRSAKTAAFLLVQLDRLKQVGIRVFYIKGNHDAENPLTGETKLPDNVHVFDARGGKVQLDGSDVWIHGVSFSGKKAEKSLLEKFSPPVADAINIGMLHTSLNGSASHDVYAPCTVQELVNTGFDYWALGHIHKREVHSTAPWIVMPGIPQGRDIGESGPQAATLISIEGDSIKTSEFATSSIEFTTLQIEVTALQDPADLQALAKKALNELLISLVSDDAIVRVRLHGQSALRWQWLRDREQLEETFNLLCRDSGRLWMEKLVFDVDDNPVPMADVSALGELSQIMMTIGNEDAFNENAAELVEKVLSVLPPSERNKLRVTETSTKELVDSLSAQGREQLMAVMKAVGEKGGVA